MLKDADVRGCWPSPRWPLGPSPPWVHPQHHTTPGHHDFGQAWAPEPPASGSRKASQPGAHPRLPTWECGLGRPGAASRTGRPQGWVSEAQPLRSRLQGRDCDSRWAPVLIRPRCTARALSLFLRIPEEERNQRLGIEKQG